MTTGIAIVGAACRFPDANSPEALWEAALAGRRAFRRVPAERLRLDDYAADADADGIYVREAAVLEGYHFDRVAFRVSGDAYRSADLAHWLALDVASAALRDAGCPDGAGLPKERTGVLIGNTLTGEFSRAGLMRLRWPYVRRVVDAELAAQDWNVQHRDEFLDALELRYKEPFEPPGSDTLAGGLSNTIAGRICNHFDFGGGGYTVDGACASSLLAVARACSALEAAEIDAAVVGGVDLSLDPFELVGFSRAGALARGGMRVFDATPTGFLPGEGCGVVVLMRDDDAIAHHARRHAVIRGWGISSDGAGGLTRPEVHGQVRALRRAYDRAKIDVATVGYFEGHGTGTAVGDATELRALMEVRRSAGPAGRRAVIGSVKANIGHTKAAAGIAGLIKATMALKTQVLPPTIGCDTPHEALLEHESSLRVLARGERWPHDLPLRAGVSAMGFGGINVHVVLDSVADTRRRSLASHERVLLTSSQDTELFLLDGADLGDVARAAVNLAVTAESLAHCELADLATALMRRSAVAPARGAVIASSPAQLAERLQLLAERAGSGHVGLDMRRGVFLGHGVSAPRVGLLFPGQGIAANTNGGVLRSRFAAVDALWREARLPSTGDSLATEIAQPSIVTASVAALRVLAALGIEAVGAVGHSLGELTALHWGGALSLDALLRTARLRGRAMADIGSAGGAMAAVAASEQRVRALLDGDRVVVAGINAARQTVVSGEAAGVELVTARARAQGIEAHKLATSHAFHSPLVAAAEAPLRHHLASEVVAPLSRRVASTVLGRVLTPEDDLRALLCAQVTSPVRFLDAVKSLADDVDLWIEAGPGRVLTGLLDADSPAPVVSMDVGAPSLRGLLEVVACAHALGAPVNARALTARRFVRPFDLARRMTFLANPCERAPIADERSPQPARARPSESSPPPTTRSDAVSRNGDALHLVARLVATRAELPIESVRAEQLLLRDLHLNSIVVAQIASDAARELSLAPSAAPTEFSGASVGDLARALEQRLRVEGARDTREDVAGRAPEGAATWVRPFRMCLAERPLPQHSARGLAGEWRVLAAENSPLAAALREQLSAVAGNGIAVVLPAEPTEDCVAILLEAAHALLALPAPRRALFVQQRGGASAFARTLHLESPGATVCVVDVQSDSETFAPYLVAEVAAAHGFVEAHYDARMRRHEPVLRPVRLDTLQRADTLDAHDVVLVTGGAKGITAECVQALGVATGARFALMGRSPASDADVAATLDRLSSNGIVARYVSTDVTDAMAVASAVAEIENTLGPVTAIIHAAGINEPCLLTAVTADVVRRTLAPKLGGLRNVIDAVDPARLHLLVTFASTIGRSGLRGAAGYALANDWTAELTERIGRARPHCRCVALEWSIWAGAGMGTKLGQLGTMAREGVTAVMPSVGVDLCTRLLRAELPDARIVVMGRYGNSPLLPIEMPELPVHRFLERVRVHYPGVELVADAVLSRESDPYLADHVFAGEQLLPGVMGLEAMAQIVVAVTGTTVPPTFDAVEFARPIVVPRDAPLIIRVAAVVRESGDVDVVVRSEETAFAVDHFRARCRVGTEVPLQERAQWSDEASQRNADELEDAAALYGDILFQTGRFRRLESYRQLRSRACDAVIAPAGEVPWFGPYHSQQLVLGDPGARDVALHAIQACVPHRTLLPRSARGITSMGLGDRVPLFARARELASTDDLYTYAVDIVDKEGRVCERWAELQLRVVRAAPRAPRVRALLGPYFERRMAELAPGTPVATRVLTNGAAKQSARTTDVHRSHARSLTLAMTSTDAVSCDVESVRDRPAAAWRDLLTASRMDLVDVVCRATAEPRAHVATRVWSAAECLTKAGISPGAPLTLDDVASDGWIQFRSGDATVATYVADLLGEEFPLSFALLVPTHA